MTDMQALREALDELDDAALQQMVNDQLARRSQPSSRAEAGLAEARRRFGDQTNGAGGQR